MDLLELQTKIVLRRTFLEGKARVLQTDHREFANTVACEGKEEEKEDYLHHQYIHAV